MFDQIYCAGMTLGAPQISLEGLTALGTSTKSGPHSSLRYQTPAAFAAESGRSSLAPPPPHGRTLPPGSASDRAIDAESADADAQPGAHTAVVTATLVAT